MSTKLKAADIVIVGLGWTGASWQRSLPTLVCRSLCLNVASRAIPIRISCIQMSRRTQIRTAPRIDAGRLAETLTFRNNSNQTALPMRQLGSFRPAKASVAPACIGTA